MDGRGESSDQRSSTLQVQGRGLPVIEPLQDYSSGYKAVPYLKPLGMVFEQAPVLRRVRPQGAFMVPMEETNRRPYVVQPLAQRQVGSFRAAPPLDDGLRQKEISDILAIIRDSAELRSDFERSSFVGSKELSFLRAMVQCKRHIYGAESRAGGEMAPRRKWAEENHDWATARFAGRKYYGKDKKTDGMPDISNMFGMSQSATRAAEGASVAQKAAQIVAEQAPASAPSQGDEVESGAACGQCYREGADREDA
ncbi:hypothetical protein GUITHDRAFT_133903 [Guillardia theta CCMP2712]|uniref:Uncharacterized protein n=1 Tax=Guillardia theta (strain CCMP2712) TaxID=905079 RepID=L1JV37_GUITC|nr:hypothetical protein GUITHDRAFT_133903 [Guillardia theta CCMP2712]EKX52184.1 hypothetical protein GUITHDRAFT_133903 [Guillardia theta CCMP2712]|eukprot:XP_005839164.1 hypothetical protein GUITHDRAFT_133903 [Guillardia theta CCMP2712]